MTLNTVSAAMLGPIHQIIQRAARVNGPERFKDMLATIEEFSGTNEPAFDGMRRGLPFDHLTWACVQVMCSRTPRASTYAFGNSIKIHHNAIASITPHHYAYASLRIRITTHSSASQRITTQSSACGGITITPHHYA